MVFKETYSGVYLKGSNSWIYSTDFKPLLLTLIFQCGINPLFFLLRILSIFKTHTRHTHFPMWDWWVGGLGHWQNAIHVSWIYHGGEVMAPYFKQDGEREQVDDKKVNLEWKINTIH